MNQTHEDLNNDLKTAIDYYNGDLLKTVLYLLRCGYFYANVIAATGYKVPETHVIQYSNSGSWQLFEK